MSTTRRGLLAAVATVGVGIAGCVDTTSDAMASADVIAGPSARRTFQPKRLTVSVGDSITWYFDSVGHNVSCVPDHSEVASLPRGAEPFSSYRTDQRYRTVGRGETYTHSLSTPGVYTYVCIPHAPEMQGELHVNV